MELLTGIFLGITTSIVAGLFLTWKGEKIVEYLRRLPEKRRIALFTQAYIIGLRSYPYRFLHFQALLLYATVHFLGCIAYAFFTAVSFRAAYGVSIAIEPDKIRGAVRTFDPLSYSVTPWLLLAFTVVLVYWTVKIFYRKLMPEALAPYGYHELRRVHDCVAKIGTKQQYINYVNAETEVRDNSSLLRLLDVAQVALGDCQFDLIARIRRGITPSKSTEPLGAINK